ncbi:hypothetical protein Hanom_Chr07g00587261 [Helianthus anomalus]
MKELKSSRCTSDGSKGGEGGCGRMMWWRKARERLNLEREKRVERERRQFVFIYILQINKLNKITNSPSCARHMSNLT